MLTLAPLTLSQPPPQPLPLPPRPQLDVPATLTTASLLAYLPDTDTPKQATLGGNRPPWKLSGSNVRVHRDYDQDALEYYQIRRYPRAVVRGAAMHVGPVVYSFRAYHTGRWLIPGSYIGTTTAGLEPGETCFAVYDVTPPKNSPHRQFCTATILPFRHLLDVVRDRPAIHPLCTPPGSPLPRGAMHLSVSTMTRYYARTRPTPSELADMRSASPADSRRAYARFVRWLATPAHDNPMMDLIERIFAPDPPVANPAPFADPAFSVWPIALVHVHLFAKACRIPRRWLRPAVLDLLNDGCVSGFFLPWKNGFAFEIKLTALYPRYADAMRFLYTATLPMAQMGVVSYRQRVETLAMEFYYEQVVGKAHADKHMYVEWDRRRMPLAMEREPVPGDSLRRTPRTFMDIAGGDELFILYCHVPPPSESTTSLYVAAYGDYKAMKILRSLLTWLLDRTCLTAQELADVTAFWYPKRSGYLAEPEHHTPHPLEEPTDYARVLRTQRIVLGGSAVPVLLTDEQCAFLRKVRHMPMNFLFGLPGTGKSLMFRVLTQLYGVDQVAIITGYGTMASLHRSYNPNAMTANLANAYYAADTPALNALPDGDGTLRGNPDIRVVLLDEAGVVSLEHLLMIRRAFPCMEKLVLAGDPDQAGCIGRGAVLDALLTAFGSHSAYCTTLTRVFRTEGARSNLNEALTRIREKRGDKIGASPNLHTLNNPVNILPRHRSLMDTFAPLLAYYPLAEDWPEIQIICQRRIDRDAIRAFFARHSPVTAPYRQMNNGRAPDDHDLCVGESAMFLRAVFPYQYMTQDNRGRDYPALDKQDRIYKNSLFVITEILDVYPSPGSVDMVLCYIHTASSPSARCAAIHRFEHIARLHVKQAAVKAGGMRMIVFNHGSSVLYYRPEVHGCMIRGTAVTIEAMQGGQQKTIIYYIHNDAVSNGQSLTLTRNDLYSGCSRAQERLIIIGSKYELGVISKRDPPVRRNLLTYFMPDPALIARVAQRWFP